MTVDGGLDLAVSLCGNDGGDVPGAKVSQDEVGVQHAGYGPGSSMTGA